MLTGFVCFFSRFLLFGAVTIGWVDGLDRIWKGRWTIRRIVMRLWHVSRWRRLTSDVSPRIDAVAALNMAVLFGWQLRAPHSRYSVDQSSGITQPFFFSHQLSSLAPYFSSFLYSFSFPHLFSLPLISSSPHRFRMQTRMHIQSFFCRRESVWILSRELF